MHHAKISSTFYRLSSPEIFMRWQGLIIYTDREFNSDARRIERQIHTGRNVFYFCNNDADCSPPLNAAQWIQKN